MLKKNNVWLAVAAIIAALLLSATVSAGTFMAGAAVADITPDVKAMKVPSSGYGERGKKPMTGVRDPVRCKALVVSDGKSEAAIVTCDLIGISPALRDKVLAGLAGTKIADQNLMMCASHTHSGPGAMMKNAVAGLIFGRYNDQLTQQTADRIVVAVKAAEAAMKPAVLRFAETATQDLVRNRRDPGSGVNFNDRTGKGQAGSYNYDTRRFSPAYDPNNPKNIIDPTLTLFRFDDLAGKPIAVLFHFPAHGTVFGADNMLISADWMGAAQHQLEAAIPGAVVLYMTGAQGDQEPTMLQDQITDDQYVELIGGKVADVALGILDKATPVEATPVRAIKEFREVNVGGGLKFEGITAPAWLIHHYFPGLPLQVIRMGDVVFMGCPVEMIAEIGLTMKNGAKGEGVKYPIVAGLANDLVLYAATPEEFPRGGYEVGNTIFGPIEAGLLIGEQMLLVRQVLRPQ